MEEVGKSFLKKMSETYHMFISKGESPKTVHSVGERTVRGQKIVFFSLTEWTF
jgi:hypothetical protein